MEGKGERMGLGKRRDDYEETIYVGPAVAEHGEMLDGEAVTVLLKEGYGPLLDVLVEALDEAQIGKGKERHATDKPFTQQPIMTIQGLVGRGYALGQAIKKTQESQRLGDDAAKRELLGAINYLAAAVLSYDD
jgi:hypothetical protein